VELAELQVSVHTDRSGSFVFLEVPAGEWTLRVGALGYLEMEERIQVPDGGVLELDLELELNPVRVPGITAEASRGTDRAGPGALRITMEAAKVVPALAEPDLLRAAQMLPSVSAASDYSSALYVRGGTPDHTLVLLDGFPIFNPYHFGGLFGAFNPDAVDEVEFIPGALPAAYGDRLASVVSVHTREGSQSRHRGTGGFGLVSTRAAVDGPLPGGGGSYLLSLRKSYLNLVGGGVTGEGVMPASLESGFQDLLLTLNREVGPLGHLSAVLFADGEWINLPSTYRGLAQYDWDWGNRLAGITLRKPLGLTTVGRFRAGWTEFRTDLDSWWKIRSQGARDPTATARGTMRDLILGLDLERRTAAHEISLGIQGDLYFMDYDSWRAEDPPEGLFEEYVPNMDLREDLGTLAAYVEDLWDLSPDLHVRAGARLLIAEDAGPEWGPRLGLRWDLSDALTFSVGGGRYFQPLHSIRVEEAVGTNFMSYDLLRPLSHPSAFSWSDDVVVGLSWSSESLSLRLDGYSREVRGLRLPPIPADPRHAQVIEPSDYRPGSGEAFGLEFLGQYGGRLLGVWTSYAFVHARTTVDGIEITPRHERRHSLDLMTRLSLPDGIRLTVRSLFATGQPTTPADGMTWPPVFDPPLKGFSNDPPTPTLLLGAHNSVRTPAYWRIDVGSRFSFDREIAGLEVSLSPYAEIINLFNVGNVVFWEPSSPNRRDDPFLQLPMTFTAGLEWSF
jgi:hypothetical protein